MAQPTPEQANLWWSLFKADPAMTILMTLGMVGFGFALGMLIRQGQVWTLEERLKLAKDENDQLKGSLPKQAQEQIAAHTTTTEAIQAKVHEIHRDDVRAKVFLDITDQRGRILVKPESPWVRDPAGAWVYAGQGRPTEDDARVKDALAYLYDNGLMSSGTLATQDAGTHRPPEVLETFMPTTWGQIVHSEFLKLYPEDDSDIAKGKS